VQKHGLGGALTHGWDKLLIVIAAFALLTLTKLNPALIILAAAMLGALAYQ
jgi:hypothetical protein